MAEKYSIVCTYYIFLLHLFVDWHLGCFYVLAVVNSASMNIGVQVSFQTMFFFGYMPRNGIQNFHSCGRTSVMSSFSSLWVTHLAGMGFDYIIKTLLPASCCGFFVFECRISFWWVSISFVNGYSAVSCDFDVFVKGGDLKSYPIILSPHLTQKLMIWWPWTCCLQISGAQGLIMSAPVTPLCYLTINQPENCALIDYILLNATHLPDL